MKLVVGLGNPGKKYEYTRHNLGMRVVRDMAKKRETKFKKKWFSRSLIASSKIDNEDIRFVCPLTFMNLSGQAVSRLVKRETVDLSDLLVICDDVNLELGKIHIRPSGSDGGHNGLKSIIEALRTNQFSRVRIGIGSPGSKEELSDFVLSDLTRKEEVEFVHSITMAQDCCEVWIRDGVKVAMSKFN